MKIKSSRLRFLITLHTLYKYSDKSHRINITKLNEHLAPHGLSYAEGQSLSKNIYALREYGISVPSAGSFDKKGYWIEDTLIPEEAMYQLAFAITTNPYLSQAEATALLTQLKALVSVYDEPKLDSMIQSEHDVTEDQVSASYAYSMTAKAILQCRSLRCRFRFQTAENRYYYITPKCIYQHEGQMYLIGYLSSTHRVRAFDLRDLTEIGLSTRRSKEAIERANSELGKVDPRDLITVKSKPSVF